MIKSAALMSKMVFLWLDIVAIKTPQLQCYRST